MGRRSRRLRRVVGLLLAVAVAALVGGLLVYRATRTETRRPGEELAEITERLSLDLPASAPRPAFVDVTAEAGLAQFVTFVGDRSSQLPEDMGSGAAWGDYDNDGDDDLFLVGAGGTMSLPPEQWAPSLLYENDGGRFRRVEAFPETRLLGMSAAWGDYDGDGWLDLVVTGFDSLLLFHNRQGELTRTDLLGSPDGWWAGATWGDFDNDRDLDLYVCGYVRYEPVEGGQASRQYGAEVPFTLNPASFEPESNRLYRNDGDGSFSEVAEIYGVSNPGGRSLSALWHDFDDDGWLDLYVANDISDNALYLNRRETFEDAGLAAWVADYRGAMGLTAGDWNRDGDDDLFITHWIAQENALYDSRLVDMAGTATARSALTFSDLGAPLGLGQVALQSVGWGTEFADFDGDGWLDLVVSNGSTLETDEVPKGLKRQPAMLFWNREGKHFHDLAPLNAELATPRVGRGLALSDYDLDGDLDILQVQLGEGVQLLRNDMQTGNWLELRLRTPPRREGDAPGFAPGARVVVEVGGARLRRTIGGSSYLSQTSLTLHFGLGSATSVDRIEVRWPAGELQHYAGVPANGVWELIEGEPQARNVSSIGGGDERQRLVDFWSSQRAAMNAMKVDGDPKRAIGLFRQALELNPEHEDSRYYLANCLMALGRIDDGLAELDTLRRLSPESHRAHKQWAVMRATYAESETDLRAAHAALERALEINPEETGSLLALGEVALLLGDDDEAQERLAQASRTNPKAVSSFFFRAYLAWKRGQRETSVALLERASAARGVEWKPEGAVAEGDVARRMHSELSPLSRYWQEWDGSSADPSAVFRQLEAHLESGRL